MPTSALELVLVTCTIKVQEKRDVAITKITGAYLSTKIDKLVAMLLHGALVELLNLIGHALYQNYVLINRNENTILYMKLQKEICWYIRTALLFYEKIVRELKGTGIIIIPYDPMCGQ